MEQAIIINRSSDLCYWRRKYKRLYAGNEFCTRLLPTVSDFKKIIKFVRHNKLELTFLTPQIGQKGLKKVKRLMQFLFAEKILSELVVNDYGLLYYTHCYYPQCRLVLGRSLAHFIKAPVGNFFLKMRVEHFETDWPADLQYGKFDKTSFYYPFSVYSSTRYCAFAGLDKSQRPNPGIIDCQKECLSYGAFKINSPVLPRGGIIQGNTQWVNLGIPDMTWLKKKRVSRLVFQPHVPI